MSLGLPVSPVFIMGSGGSGLSRCSIIVHIDTGSSVAAYSNPAATDTYLVKTGREIGTTGDYIISGLEVGTYYVKATKSGKTKVSSAVTFQSYSVLYLVMNYSMLLYSYGDENTSVTGGWAGVSSTIFGGENAAAPSITRYSDHLYADVIGIGNYKGGYITTGNPINLTGYTQLHLICQTANAFSNKLGVLNSAKNTIRAQQTLSKNTSNNIYINISSINESCFVAISLQCETTDDRYIPSISLVELL